MAEPTVARVRRRVLALAAEDAYGQDKFNGNITAADVLFAYNIRPASRIEVIETLAQVGFLGRLRGGSGLELFGLSYDIQIRGAGAPYSAAVVPDYHNPLRAAGMLATLDNTGGAEKYTYTPRSSGFESFTAYMIQENGPTHIGVGCFGSATLRGIAGQPGVLSQTLVGIFSPEQSEELVVKAPTQLLAPPFKAADLKIGLENYAACVQNVELAMNLSVEQIPCANADTALAGMFVADRDIGGSFDPEVVPADTFEWYEVWRTKPPEIALSWQWGTSQYNRCKVAMSEIEIQERGWGERNRMAAFQVAYKARPSTAGDDELTITAD